MIVARVLVGVTETASSAPGASTGPLPYFSRGGRCIDTITISNKTFVKLHPSEAYPYQVLRTFSLCNRYTRAALILRCWCIGTPLGSGTTAAAG